MDQSEPRQTKSSDRRDLETMRHSAAHVMVAAVQRLFPGTKLGVGPTVEHGFYYDMEVPRPLTSDDLPVIEAEMHKILAERPEFEREEMPIETAIDYFRAHGQDYKVELLSDLKERGTTRVTSREDMDVDPGNRTSATMYRTGEFVDLCRGPHVPSAGRIGPFKLLSVSGAYWRGDEHRPMLQRIYGTAWFTREQLDHYLWQLDEAERRDHRRIGRDLGLFMFDEEVGPGLPLWLPNGTVLIEELERLAKETEERAGYVRVRTPHVAKESMYLRSGHLPYYAESMFPPMELEGVRYYLKPMNCPHHHKIYAAQQRSYRDIPLRLAEYGTCYRYEKSGELFGLMRVRSLQMNDAHIYCTLDQIEDEFLAVCRMYLGYFELFGIDQYLMRFSTHDPNQLGGKYVDQPELWKKTEEIVRRALDHGRINYTETAGEAAFYGPKIDVQVWSAIGREFTLATNQVDFAVPERFGLTYVNARGEHETPICIHRAPLGTHERMIGFLIEHYAGAFPLWLAPVQAVVLPIADRHAPYAEEVGGRLRARGFRAHVDTRRENLNHKIRDAQLQKIPYMLVVGDRELEAGTAAVRLRSGENIGTISVDDLLARLDAERGQRQHAALDTALGHSDNA
ncbi:MAG: threonine--tRNA ligase [Chloroflexi bacterium]|nr:threonine--tRNA ligase [Chloroflexota bacterium]